MSPRASREQLEEGLGIVAEKATEAGLSDRDIPEQNRDLRCLGAKLAIFVTSISSSAEAYPDEIVKFVEQAIYPLQLTTLTNLRDEPCIEHSLREFHSNSKPQFDHLMSRLSQPDLAAGHMGALLKDPLPPQHDLESQPHRRDLGQTLNFTCADMDSELRHAYIEINNRTHCDMESTHEHEKHLRQVNLRLQPLEDEPFHLELIFNARPACSGIGGICLHETEMRVDIADEESGAEVERDEDPGSEVDSFMLCPSIATAHGGRLKLSLVVDKKSYEPPTVFAGRSLPTLRNLVPGEPAGDSFSNLANSFTTDDIISLAFILTKSIWQLYCTHWLSKPWTADDIHFLSSRDQSNDQRGTDPNLLPSSYPYVRVALPQSKEAIKAINPSARLVDYSDEDGASLGRTFPDVLALGVLFIELLSKTKLAPQNDGSSTPIHGNLLQYRNLGIFTIADTLPTCSNRQLLLGTSFKEILQKIFRNTLFRGHKGDGETSARRSTLFKLILDPIRRAYEVGVQGRMHIGHGHLALRGSGTYVPGQPTTDFDYGMLLDKLADYCGTNKNCAKTKCAIEELQQFAEISKFFKALEINGEPWKAQKPIRVVVLDTGCDLQNRFFTRTENPDNARRIRWHDFVKPPRPDPVDEDQNQHGTHIATLLLMLLPMCEVYVGRVATSQAEVSKSAENIAEARAIEHAWKEWDADIISMSWGFHEEKRAIKRAIDEAIWKRDSGILFFAAANNEGFKKSELFPACHYKNVISVGGADDLGEPAKGLCPNPRKVHSEGVFSALGVSVPSGDWEEQVGRSGKPQIVPLAHSGSSFATPVLAATAALFLHYAKFAAEYQPKQKKRLQKFFEPDGMRALFRKIGQVNQATEGKRWFVQPDQLFEQKAIGEMNHEVLILDMLAADR